MEIFTYHDKKTGGLIPADNMGFIYSKSEMKEMMEQFVKFYNGVNEEYIEEHNKERAVQLETPITYEPKKNEKEGVVYFLRADNGLTKIGETKDLETRLKAISGSLLNETELLLYIESEDVRKLEEMFHEQFKDKRVKGEWFDLSDSDIWNVKRQMIHGSKGDGRIE